MPSTFFYILGAVSLLTPLYPLLRKNTCVPRYILGALLTFATLYAFAASLYPPDNAIHDFAPFKPLLDIPAYGYASIFHSFVQFALPFAPLGLLAPLVLPRAARSMGRVALAALLLTLVSFALRLCLPLQRSVNIDECWYAALGAASGFALYTLLSWIWLRRTALAQKWRLFDPRSAGRIAALAVLALVYFGAAIIMVIDSNTVAPLNLPQGDTPLPLSRSADFAPDESPARVALYKAAETNMDLDFAALAEALDIGAQAALTPTEEDIADGTGRFYAERVGRSIEVLQNGEWRYMDKMAEAASESPYARSEDESIALAQAFLDSTGLCPERALSDVSRMRAFDEEGEEIGTSQYVVYFSSVVDGRAVRASGEIVVTVGYEGKIVSAVKHGPAFAKDRDAGIIPLGRALEDALTKDVAHTLYSEADAVVFTGGELVYWYDENEGLLTPVWVLSGKAYSAEGERAFEAFVEARAKGLFS